VRAGETADATFSLELGQVIEVVSVNDAVSALDTTNAQIQQAMDAKQVADVPPTFQQVNRTITSPSFGTYTDTALNSRLRLVILEVQQARFVNCFRAGGGISQGLGSPARKLPGCQPRRA
jgi:hypothetical protein